MLVYGFLSVIVAITMFHIMNTVRLGVAARTRQYGALRAIGMSGRQLTRMVAAEAVAYAAGVILLTTALSVRGPVRRLRALPIVETLTVQ